MLKRMLLSFLLLNLSFPHCDAIAGGEDFRIFSLQYRFPQDVLPSVQALVGDSGTVSVMQNHLIVRTTPQRMEEVAEVVARMDTPPVNHKISISFADTTKTQGRGVDVDFSTGNDHVNIKTSRHADSGVQIDLSQREKRIQLQAEQFLTVLDGYAAFIKVGQSIPFTQDWLVISQQYVSAQRLVSFREVTTGFSVKPRAIGDQVELEITPRIVSLGQGGVVDFQTLTTVLRVRKGEWLDIGQQMQGRDEVSRAILSSRNASSQTQGGFRIRVD